MKLSIGIAALVVTGAAALSLVLRPHPPDPLAEFRASERSSLAAFNAALHRQRANQLDEPGLAEALEREVLPAWRTMREHVEAGELPAAMRDPMHRYLADRQLAWEAYAAALRAPSDVAARPHYDVYHRKNAEADADARAVAELMR